MPTLAPKLPWQHAFAGGYPRRGGQPLPTDADAIDYLNRVAAADGAAVEVGIAQAIDAFVRGCKADSAGYAGDPTRSNWDAIQASCILCGARTVAGALVPLKGTAPSQAPAPNNFVSGDYSRSGATPGLKGDGTTKYLDSNRANNADGQNDQHLAVYATALGSTSKVYLGSYSTATASGSQISDYNGVLVTRLQSVSQTILGVPAVGLMGASRDNAEFYTTRTNGTDTSVSVASAATSTLSLTAFAFNNTGTVESFSSGRLAFYSIGSALDLAALDTRVTNMVTAIRFHSLTGLLPNDYDPATIAYITAAYAAGGTL